MLTNRLKSVQTPGHHFEYPWNIPDTEKCSATKSVHMTPVLKVEHAGKILMTFEIFTLLRFGHM